MKYLYVIYSFLLIFSIACNQERSNINQSIVVSNIPTKMIVRELMGNKIKIHCLTQQGDSPHIYSPKPSDAQKAENARLLIYISHSLDAWAASFNNQNKLELIKLLPEEYLLYSSDDHSGHNHGSDESEHCCDHQLNNENHQAEKKLIDHQADNKENDSYLFIDPHFWLDPLAVKALIPKLKAYLIESFPDWEETIQSNSILFEKKLDNIHKTIEKELKNVKGKYVFSFHPSFEYYIKRYGLKSGGSIEVLPGKEPSPNYINDLSKLIKSTKTKTIFSEPQLPAKTAVAMAEMTHTKLKILDPLGGGKNMLSYFDLLFYNTIIFKENL